MLEINSRFPNSESTRSASHGDRNELPPLPGDASRRIADALTVDNFTPVELIAALKEIPAVTEALSGPAFDGECRYDLETHTRRVLEQAVKHFDGEPAGFEGGLFYLALALHDIGKPAALAGGTTQHAETALLIIGISDRLPFDRAGLSRLLALVDGDPLGRYLQGFASLEDTTREILERSARAGLTPGVYLAALEQYYQCDVSAYTSDAGCDARLDHLFVWEGGTLRIDAASRRFPFNASYIEEWDRLRLRVSSPSACRNQGNSEVEGSTKV